MTILKLNYNFDGWFYFEKYLKECIWNYLNYEIQINK